MPVLPVVLVAGDRRQHALLSTDHAASSYGLPVLVLDGRALGPADLPAGAWIEAPAEAELSPHRVITHWPLIEAARAAGYRAEARR